MNFIRGIYLVFLCEKWYWNMFDKQKYELKELESRLTELRGYL